MEHYIEDILHLLVDEELAGKSDRPILTSISKQCKKGVALTDRQYEFVKNKLNDYADELEKRNVILIPNANIETRLPIRTIDRSKYVTIVKHSDMLGPNRVYESYKDSWLWIKIRFPFSKKDITALESLKRFVKNSDYNHQKGSHEHYFKLKPIIASEIVKTFSNRFTIDENIIEYANKVIKIVDNPDIVNLFEKTKQFLLEDVSELSETLIKDRSIKYGYSVPNLTSGSLSSEIANRENNTVRLDPNQHSLNKIAESFLTLERFPVIAIIDESEELDQVSSIYNAFNGIVPAEQQTVLFRVDNKNNEYTLNDFVKEKQLNNWLDKNTQIVYIKKNKLPKVLVKSDCKPKTALGITAIRSTSHVETYISYNCDLICFTDIVPSNFSRKSWF